MSSNLRRTTVLLVPALLAAGAWFLLRPGEDPSAPPGGTERGGEAGSDAPELGSTRLEGRASTAPPREAPAPKPNGSVDWRTIPRGTLEVLVLGPDDAPIPAGDVTLFVSPGRGGRAWPTQPLLLADYETNAWKNEEIPAGWVDVRVSGEHIVTRTVETEVLTGVSVPLRVHVDRAASIDYQITLLSGAAPENIKISLLDEKRKPVPVTYQTRNQAFLAQPQAVFQMAVGSEGSVFGVPPGRYTLRAVSPEDEFEESVIDAVAGQTHAVKLSIRK